QSESDLYTCIKHIETPETVSIDSTEHSNSQDRATSPVINSPVHSPPILSQSTAQSCDNSDSDRNSWSPSSTASIFAPFDKVYHKPSSPIKQYTPMPPKKKRRTASFFPPSIEIKIDSPMGTSVKLIKEKVESEPLKTIHGNPFYEYGG